MNRPLVIVFLGPPGSGKGTQSRILSETLSVPHVSTGEALREAVNTSVSEEELRIAKEQAIASILLGLESSSARASTLARQEIIHGRRISPDEVVAKIRAATPDDLREIAQTYFKSELVSLGALGNLNGFKVDRARLEI